MNEIEKVPAGEGAEYDYDQNDKKLKKKSSSAQEWWVSYAALANDDWNDFPHKNDLILQLKGDENLSKLVAHFVGLNYKKWLDEKRIPDLGGFSPRECLETEWGNKRLRMLFLCMH